MNARLAKYIVNGLLGVVIGYLVVVGHVNQRKALALSQEAEALAQEAEALAQEAETLIQRLEELKTGLDEAQNRLAVCEQHVHKLQQQ